MKNQGITDDRIIMELQKQGISPKEISNALSQAQIKNAVSADTFQMQPPRVQEQEDVYEAQEPPTPQQYSQQVPQQQNYQEYYPQEQPSYDSSNQQTYGQDYSNYSPSDTIIEISEQVFNEKSKKLQKQVDDMSEFKSLAQVKIENIDERLKRMEKTIDQLQIEILQKVGSYGSGLDSIKKEMSMMQDSFGKMVGHAVSKHEHTSTEKKSKKK
ncbi:MAG: hypothetical protein Q7R95_08495 [bacterium]|nr:hypothetical protein [bacterium]